MPRTLADLTDAERKALLNAHWDSMVRDEIASPVGTNSPIDSPLGKTAALPHDLASHLVPGRGAGATHAWDVKGICGVDALKNADKVSQPGVKLGFSGGEGGTLSSMEISGPQK
jgi:hypothetical protein